MDGGARLKEGGRIERKGAKEGKYKGKKEKGRREDWVDWGLGNF